jgi:hypothetical protein
MLALGLSLLAMVVIVAAGCGGGGSKNTAATTEAATTEAMTTEEATTTEAAATTEATTTEATTTEATTTASSDLSGLASSGNCKELADLGQKFSSALSGAASSQDLKKEADLLKEFAAKTPQEIRPDFEVYADFVGKVADAYKGITPGQTPSPTQIAALQKLSTTIDQAKLTAASQHIAAWVQSNCHA